MCCQLNEVVDFQVCSKTNVKFSYNSFIFSNRFEMQDAKIYSAKFSNLSRENEFREFLCFWIFQSREFLTAALVVLAFDNVLEFKKIFQWVQD